MNQVTFYDFYGSKVTEDRPALLEMGIGSTAEGYVEVIIPGVESDYTIDSEVYKLDAPTAIESRYIKTGLDLLNPQVLYISSEIMSNGNLRIFYRFDPSSITGADHGDFYGITFFINRLLTASSVKVSANVVIHIVNKFRGV